MYYLDHCGTTPLDPDVSHFMKDLIDANIFGNPSASHHEAGRHAFDMIENARETCERLFNAKNSQVLFTSSATEANNIILAGFASRYKNRTCRILYSAIEHKSVLETCQSLNEWAGVSTIEIPVFPNGRLDLDFLESELMKDNSVPTLVTIMHINNELPIRNPVEQISTLCLKYNAFFHSDGVQGYVREPLNFNENLFGSYTISSHKIYGPKGLGILVLGSGPLSPRLLPYMHGGDQEFGLRPGTLNTLAIAAGAKAIEIHEKKRVDRIKHMHDCAHLFSNYLKNHLKSFHLTIPIDQQAAGIVNFYIENQDSQSLLLKIPRVCINRGASCLGAGGERYSHVPRALGLPIEIQANILRASFGDGIKLEDIEKASQLVVEHSKK
jgi:cysteine desulfurase